MPLVDDRSDHLKAQQAFASEADERVLRELSLPPGRLLDLTGGAGGLAARLAGEGWQVTAVHADPSVVAAARDMWPGVDFRHLDVFGPGELEPLAEHSFDLAFGPGAFPRALTTLDIDSLLYGLARVLKPEGRALLSVLHEAPPGEPVREGPRELEDGRRVWRTQTCEPVAEEGPERPEELSPLIPLVRVQRVYEFDPGERIEQVEVLRLWEMSEVLQVAHRCLMDVGRRWRNHDGGTTMLEIRVPPPIS